MGLADGLAEGLGDGLGEGDGLAAGETFATGFELDVQAAESTSRAAAAASTRLPPLISRCGV